MTHQVKKVLVIDDESHLLFGLRALLEHNGYQVSTHSISADGVKAAFDQHPDIIICDIMMPMENGFQVRERLSRYAETCDIPFLFLTARANQTDKLRGLNSGADDYITKPFDPRELLARIEATLRRQEKGKSAAEHEMAAQIDRIRTEISRNLSHELRTPMTQILMALEMILRDKYTNPADLKWFVETALSQSYRLNSLIDDLVFLSMHDSGQFSFLRQKLDLNLDFMEPIAVRSELYNEKNLEIKFNRGANIIIHSPRREFRQAMLHLVDNAMKFAPPNSPININLEPNGKGGCILIIEDQGMGIPPELQEKVFERFYQVSQGDTRQFGGMGVGLTIARAIARSLEGDVVILPTQKGCRVRMTIPPAPLDLP